jgi:hypothetical protein
MQNIYQHYENHQYYKVIDWCKIQSNDEWVDAYIYVDADAHYHVAKPKYVRSVAEFHQKFQPVLEPQVLSEIKDSYSMLDLLRNSQLADIFKKFK